MYDAATIAILEARIGFGSDAGIPIDIDSALTNGTSGRTFTYFHKLVTLPNIYACVETINADVPTFEADLQQMIADSVRGSLATVINQSVRSDLEADYSQTIQDNPELFDEVVGYNMAIAALELMVSTTRVNDEQRNANATYTKLKVELEGLIDDSGNLRSRGLNSKYRRAVKKARAKVFPYKPIVSSKKVW